MFLSQTLRGGGVAGTLDSSYFKGQGERQGVEREYLVVAEGYEVLQPSEQQRMERG